MGNHYRWRPDKGGAFVLVREFTDSRGEVREDEILKAKPLCNSGRILMADIERHENHKAELRERERLAKRNMEAS